MRVVIISGGHIDDVFALNYLKENKYDCMIAADSGMDFLYRNHLIPDVIAGDFDSAQLEGLQYFKGLNDVQIIQLNPVKDDTDTEYVLREAIRRGATEITILGATGTRLDHVLANVYLLGLGLEAGVDIVIVDAHNRIRMVHQSYCIKKEEQFGNYVSILPVGGNVKGVTLKGMKYLLESKNMEIFSSLGISNEIVDDVAQIHVEEGTLLVIESRD